MSDLELATNLRRLRAHARMRNINDTFFKENDVEIKNMLTATASKPEKPSFLETEHHKLDRVVFPDIGCGYEMLAVNTGKPVTIDEMYTCLAINCGCVAGIMAYINRMNAPNTYNMFMVVVCDACVGEHTPEALVYNGVVYSFVKVEHNM